MKEEHYSSIEAPKVLLNCASSQLELDTEHGRPTPRGMSERRVAT